MVLLFGQVLGIGAADNVWRSQHHGTPELNSWPLAIQNTHPFHKCKLFLHWGVVYAGEKEVGLTQLGKNYPLMSSGFQPSCWTLNQTEISSILRNRWEFEYLMHKHLINNMKWKRQCSDLFTVSNLSLSTKRQKYFVNLTRGVKQRWYLLLYISYGLVQHWHEENASLTYTRKNIPNWQPVLPATNRGGHFGSSIRIGTAKILL